MDMKLLTYLEKEILPLYDYLDDAHNRSHIENTVNFALELNKHFPDIKPELVITAATYHDVGLLIDRDNHHIHSAQYVLDDPNLHLWFTDEEIAYIAAACLEHRASSLKPTSLLSKIIADADRSDSIDITRMIERSYFYTKSKYMGKLSEEQIMEDVYNHLSLKFGSNGYVKFNLEETEKLLDEPLKFSKQIIDDKDLFIRTLKMFVLGRDIDFTSIVDVKEHEIEEI